MENVRMPEATSVAPAGLASYSRQEALMPSRERLALLLVGVLILLQSLTSSIEPERTYLSPALTLLLALAHNATTSVAPPLEYGLDYFASVSAELVQVFF